MIRHGGADVVQSAENSQNAQDLNHENSQSIVNLARNSADLVNLVRNSVQNTVKTTKCVIYGANSTQNLAQMGKFRVGLRLSSLVGIF